MKLKQPLTKENLFNELQEKYPKGMKVFCDWIDEYKKAVEWDRLFNSITKLVVIPPAPKFHELPHAMQLGIWLTFVCDRGGCQYEIENMFEFDLVRDITEYIKMLHNEAGE